MQSSTASDDLAALLAETRRLRIRIEQTQPDSARLSILIRDEHRLARMVEVR